MSTLKIKKIILSTMLVFAPLASHAATNDQVTVPFRIEQIAGSRPVVDITVSGKPLPVVIHANSGSYLQISHADAAAVGAHDLKHTSAYGISAPGHVDALGRDDGYVDALVIGTMTLPKVPVAVFEKAGGSEGMLGLPFLYANHVIMDYGKKEMILPGTEPSRSLAAEMQRRGYAPHKMERDPQDGRYLVKVTINGEAADMTVSTVAMINLDSFYAKRAHVATGPETGGYGGPSGATGTTHASAVPISFGIDDWKSRPMTVSIEDTYAYMKAPRPADPSTSRGGQLGADFMISTEAVIDFGNALLYLKK